MVLNIELLKRLKTRFMRMRHPEHFNMAVWAHKNECGTAMCIAGHALDLQGYKTRPKGYGSITGNLQFIDSRGKDVDVLTIRLQMHYFATTAQLPRRKMPPPAFRN